MHTRKVDDLSIMYSIDTKIEVAWEIPTPLLLGPTSFQQNLNSVFHDFITDTLINLEVSDSVCKKK